MVGPSNGKRGKRRKRGNSWLFLQNKGKYSPKKKKKRDNQESLMRDLMK